MTFSYLDAADPSTTSTCRLPQRCQGAAVPAEGYRDQSEGDLKALSCRQYSEKQLKGLEDMETWTTTIQSSGSKIAKEL